MIRPKGLVDKTSEGVSTFGRCAGCHVEQYKFWKSTAHYSAMLPLYTKDQHLNRECLMCHTIGYKENQGWSDAKMLVAHKDWNQAKFFEDIFKGDSRKPLKKKKELKRWKKLHDAYTSKLSAFQKDPDDPTKVFMGVQCEHCHGRRLNHPGDGKSYAEKVPEAACVSCHQPEHSDGFSFAERKPLVACPLRTK